MANEKTATFLTTKTKSAMGILESLFFVTLAEIIDSKWQFFITKPKTLPKTNLRPF